VPGLALVLVLGLALVPALAPALGLVAAARCSAFFFSCSP
jgi:hypothetical protein